MVVLYDSTLLVLALRGRLHWALIECSFKPPHPSISPRNGGVSCPYVSRRVSSVRDLCLKALREYRNGRC